MAKGAIFSDDVARRVRAMLEEWERSRGRSPRPTPRRRLQPSGGQVRIFQLDVGADGEEDPNEGKRFLLPDNGGDPYFCNPCFFDPTFHRWERLSSEETEVFPSLLQGAYSEADCFPAVQVGGRWYAVGGHAVFFELNGAMARDGANDASPGFYTGIGLSFDTVQTITLRDLMSFVASASSLPDGTRGIAEYMGSDTGTTPCWVPVNAGCV